MSGDDYYTSVSKTLSYHLRHNLHNLPEVSLDGYVPVRVLLQQRGLREATLQDVRQVVAFNQKKRFVLETREGELWIRAQQGHSHSAGNAIDMSQVLTKITTPMPYCVHGTSHSAYKSIKLQGISRMGRTHIHFASSPHATSGFRKHSQILVHIDMAKAMEDGILFFQSGNGVILSEGINGIIPPAYFKEVVVV